MKIRDAKFLLMMATILSSQMILATAQESNINSNKLGE